MIYGPCSLAAHVAFYPALLKPYLFSRARPSCSSSLISVLWFGIIFIGRRGNGVLFGFCLLLLFPSSLWLVIASLYHFEIYSLFNSIFIFYDYVSLTHKRVLGNMF